MKKTAESVLADAREKFKTVCEHTGGHYWDVPRGNKHWTAKHCKDCKAVLYYDVPFEDMEVK